MSTIIHQGDHGRARVWKARESARAKAEVNGSESGQKVTYDILIYIGFILLDSPLYQYKGSCFREVCADEGVVGGNLRGFYWGIHTRLFNIIHVYMLNSYHFLSFFRVK